MKKYKTVSNEELKWLKKYENDTKDDPGIGDSYAGDLYGCWCSNRSFEDYKKAGDINMKIITENLASLREKIKEKEKKEKKKNDLYLIMRFK